MKKLKSRKRKRKSRFKRGIHNSIKLVNPPAKYRSGWELAYMIWLDASPAVLNYEYESLKIPYVSNIKTGKLRNYIPDFLVRYVDGRICLVEVKPIKRLTTLPVKKKLGAAQQWASAHGVTLEIVTEHTLKGYGLL